MVLTNTQDIFRGYYTGDWVKWIIYRNGMGCLWIMYGIPISYHAHYNSLIKTIYADKWIVTNRAEKGSVTVILDKEECINKSMEILNDTSTYT